MLPNQLELRWRFYYSTITLREIPIKAVLTALENMENLASQVKHLVLAWVKSHIGTEGNEKSIQAAKDATGGCFKHKTLAGSKKQNRRLYN